MYVSSFWSDIQTPGSAESSLLQDRRNHSPAETWMDWKQLVGGVWQVPGPRGWSPKHRCRHNQEFQNSGKHSLFREGQQPTWPGAGGRLRGPSLRPTQLCRQGGGAVWGGVGPRISPEKWWEITQWSSEEHIDRCLTGAQGRTRISSKVCKSIWSEIMENRLKASPRWGGSARGQSSGSVSGKRRKSMFPGSNFHMPELCNQTNICGSPPALQSPSWEPEEECSCIPVSLLAPDCPAVHPNSQEPQISQRKLQWNPDCLLLRVRLLTPPTTSEPQAELRAGNHQASGEEMWGLDAQLRARWV